MFRVFSMFVVQFIYENNKELIGVSIMCVNCKRYAYVQYFRFS